MQTERQCKPCSSQWDFRHRQEEGSKMASGDPGLSPSGVSAMLPQQLSIPSFIDKPEDNDDNDISEDKSEGLISQLAFLEESEDKKVEADKSDEDKSISEYSDTEGSVGSDEDVDDDDADEDDEEEEDEEEEDDDDDEEDNEGEEGNENTNSGGDAEVGEDDEVEMQVNDIIQKLDMEDDNIIETKDFDDLTDDSKPSTSLFDFTPMTAEKPPETSESKPAESTSKKPKKTRKRKRKLTKEEKAERKAKRKKTVPKPLFKRRNIRQIKTEKDLDATTLAAQNEELERQRRLMEQKKAVLNKAPFHVSASGIKQENKDCQLKSLLQAVEEDAEKAAKEDMEKLEKEAKIKKELEEKKLEEKKKPPEVIDISSTDEEEERDDDSDVVMVQSDEEEDDEVDEDDPNNGGSHIDDSLNQKDEQGRVIVNVGHPPEDQDIFLSPKVAANIKPHQIGGVRFLYDNLVESISRYKSSVGFGCILAHSMGLGKTIQMIGFVDIFLRCTPAKTVLCIVPINTLQNWNSEFNMWLPPEGPAEDPEARHFKVFLLNDNLKTTKARAKVIDGWTKEGGVLLMGYEMYRLLASKRSFPAKPKKTKKPAEPEVIDVDEEDNNKVLMSDMHGSLVNPGPDLVICDEGHRIKNNAAGISQQLKNIKTKRRVVLTGYPLQNNLLEYWCMVDFVRPNFLGTKTEFCNMFERPITNGQCQDSTKDDVRVMRYRAYVLHSLLEGFVQRRGHTVLRAALPPKQEFVFLLRMSPIQKKLYSHFMKAINETNVAAFEGNNPLKAFAVCCKIWNHPDVLYKLLTGLKKGVDNDLDIETEGTTTKKKSSSKSSSKSKSSGKNSSSSSSAAAAAAAASSASASSSSTSVTSSSAAPGGMRGNPADVYNFPGTGGDSGGGLPSSGLMPGMMGGSMSWAPTGTTLSSTSGSGMVGPMPGMQGNMMGMGPMQGNMMGMGPMQGGAMGPMSGGMGQMNMQSNSGGMGQGMPNSSMGQNMPGGMGQMQGNMGSGSMGQGMPGNNMGQMQGSMPNMGPGMSSNNMGQMQGNMSSPGMGQNMPTMNMGQMQGSMGGSNMGQGMAGGMGPMQGNMANGMGQMQGSMSSNSMGQMKGGMGSGSMGPMQSNMPGSAMGQMQGNIPSNVMGPMQGSMSNSLMGQMHGMSNNMGQNMPGTNMGQNMPGNMGQNMSGSSMGQNMPGNNMGQNMPGNNMGQNMSGNLGQNMSGNMGQNMPGNNMGQNMPGNMGQNMPGNGMGQNMPGNNMGQSMPGNNMGQNMPGNNMGQNMPGNNMGQNMPGNMGQNMSGSNMGQNMSGSNMGQNMSGSNMGQNMPGNNMGPMQGNMGPMPGNLGDSMNSGGSQMCDPMTGMPFGSMFGGMGAFPAGGFLGDLNSDSMGDPMGVSLGDQMAGSPASHSRQMTGSLGSGAGSGMAGSVGGNSSGPNGNMTHPMGGGGGSMGRDAGMTGGTMDASSLGEMTGNAFRSSPGQMAGSSFGQSAGPPPDHFGNVTGFGAGQQGSDLPGVAGSMVGSDGSSGQGYTTVTTSGSTMGTGTLTDSLVNTSTTVTCSASETGAGAEPSKESSGQAMAGPATGGVQPKAETSTTSSTGTCISSSSSTSTATAMEVDAGLAAETKTSESSTGADANSGSASTSTAASTGSSSTSTTTTSTASGNIPGPVGEALASQDKKGENSISYEWAEELMKDYIPGIVENSGKMVLLLQLVEETVKIGDKILVFSQSLTTLNVIEEFLGMFDVPRPDMNEKWCRNKNYFRLDGSTSGTERERLINQFNDPDNNRFWLFLLSTRAGCLGINLVGANRVVVVDASWNPCHDCQAICRVYRFGQEKPSYIYRLVTDNSLEKKIYDRQVNKQGMSDRVIDELNPDTQFQRRKLDNLLEYEEKEEVPEIDFSNHVGEFEDPVLYKVLQTKGSWLTKNPFTHESLLIDRKEMRLTKKDKRLAKENYARDKKMNTTYARQSYAAFYPRNNMGQPQSAGVSFRTVTVNRPVASVKPMICTPVTSRKTMPVFNSNLRPGVSVHQVITTTEITLPGSNSTTEAGSVSKIPAGQRVLVIKTPKGIYIRTVDGKLFAVRSKEGTLPAGLPGATGAAASTATTLSASQSPGTIRIVTCPPGGLKKDGKDLPRIVIKDASGTGGGSVISTDLLSSIYSQTKTVNAIIQGQDPKTGAKTLIIPRTKTSTDTKDSKTAEAGTSTVVKKEGGGETKIITSASPQMLKLVSSSGQPIMARTLPSSVLSLLAGKEGLPKGATAVVISRGDLSKKGGTKDLLSLLGKNSMLKLATSATTSTTNATLTPAVSPSALGKGINLSLKSLTGGNAKDIKKIAPKTSIVQMGNNKVLILEKPNATSTKTSKTSSGASPAQAAAGEKVSKGIGADLDSSSSAAEASSGEEEGKKSRAEEGTSTAPSAEGTKASSSLSQTQSPQSTPVAGKQQQQQGAKDGGASLSKEDGRQALPVSKATVAASQSAGSQTPSQRTPGGEKATSKSVAPSPSTQTPLAGLASLAVPAAPATGSASSGKSSSSRSTANTTTSRAATSSTASSSANTTTPASTAATTASTTTSAPASVASSAASTTGASSSSSSSSSTSQTPSSAAAELRSQQSGAGSMFPLPGQPFPDPMSQGTGPPHFPPSPMVGQNLPGFPGQGLGSSHYPDSSHASQFGAFPHHGQNSFSSWPPFGQTPGFPQQLGSSLDLQSRPSFEHQPRAGSSVFDQQPSAVFDPQQPFGRQSSSSFDKPSGESAFQRHSQDSSSLFTRQGPSAFEQPSTTPAFPRSGSLFDRHPPQGFDKQPSSMFPDLSLDMGLGGPPVSSSAAAAGLGLDSKAFGPPGMSRSQLFDPFAPSYSPYSMGHSGYPMGAAQAGMGMGMQSSFPFMAPSLQSRGFGGLGEGSMFGDPTVGQSGSTVSPINNCGGTYQSASPYNLASPFQQSYYSRPYPGYQPFPSSAYMPHHLPPLMGQSPHPSQTPSALNPPTSHPPL